MRQETHKRADVVLDEISEYYIKEMGKNGITLDDEQRVAEQAFLDGKLKAISNVLLNNSLIQLIFICIALGIMFNIYSNMQRREKELEEEHLRAKKESEAKTTFLSNMSHDIRTPMNAIIGYTKLAQKEGLSMGEVQSFLSKIDSSSKHLLALINDVLEMSRIESGKMELEEVPCNLKKIMSELYDMFATQMANKSIVFTVNCNGLKNPLVYCDKNRLNRILLNLVSNAYKFTNEGGNVSVLLSEIAPANNGIGSYELRVKDNGIGMSKEFSQKVFDAFERERTSTVSGIQGTGLGMSITKSFVDMLGGEIEVKSERGEGTEFVIRINFRIQGTTTEQPSVPAEAKKESKAQDVGNTQNETTQAPHALLQEAQSAQRKENAIKAEATAAEEKDFSTMKLLLVDDVDVNREIAVMLLSEMGFSVDTAVNGKDAVEKISKSPAFTYNGVLMDIQMPIMDGYEATKAIRLLENKDIANIPIIAMTANAFSEDVKKALDSGMNAHVAKPIDLEKLEGTLRELL